jgi:hypothetical protein
MWGKSSSGRGDQSFGPCWREIREQITDANHFLIGFTGSKE